MADEIETFNKFMVACQGDDLVLMMPPRGKITQADARNLAAWLVALSGGEEKFAPVLEAVESI